MQDIHSISGARLFGGGSGDRRLRPQPHQNHQALKCPRCESLNTKFCYFNNYNLSQPRHFCKSCRRYWTKGGVLRNVPVGGRCRKTKRNSKTKNSADHSSAQPPPPPPTTTTLTQREREENSHSSSESSTTLTVTNHKNVQPISVHSSSSVSDGLITKTDNTKFFSNNNEPVAGFEPAANALLEQVSSDCWIFSEIGSFTSLITSSSETALPFGFSNLLNAQQSLEPWQQQQQQQEQQKMVSVSTMGSGDELKMQEMSSGFLNDKTVQVELSNNGGFGSLDWHGNGDQGLFDLPNVVDHASYWSQSSQWNDQGHDNLSLP